MALLWGRKGGNDKKKKKAVKKIEGPLWGYMVSQGVIVDVLQHLRYVEREAEYNGKPCLEIRIFDPAKTQAAGIEIDDFTTFDQQPEYILYEGYLSKMGEPIEVREKK